jgi:hypothetical protein
VPLAVAVPTAPQFHPPTADRCVRLCPVHGCTLAVEWRVKSAGKIVSHVDVLVCSGYGSHHDVRTWVVYDRETRRLYGAGTAARVCVLDGECEEALTALLEMGRTPLNRHKGVVPKTNLAYWRRPA